MTENTRALEDCSQEEQKRLIKKRELYLIKDKCTEKFEYYKNELWRLAEYCLKAKEAGDERGYLALKEFLVYALEISVGIDTILVADEVLQILNVTTELLDAMLSLGEVPLTSSMAQSRGYFYWRRQVRRRNKTFRKLYASMRSIACVVCNVNKEGFFTSLPTSSAFGKNKKKRLKAYYEKSRRARCDAFLERVRKKMNGEKDEGEENDAPSPTENLEDIV